jgi:hypothetical protein
MHGALAAAFGVVYCQRYTSQRRSSCGLLPLLRRQGENLEN